MAVTLICWTTGVACETGVVDDWTVCVPCDPVGCDEAVTVFVEVTGISCEAGVEAHDVGALEAFVV